VGRGREPGVGQEFRKPVSGMGRQTLPRSIDALRPEPDRRIDRIREKRRFCNFVAEVIKGTGFIDGVREKPAALGISKHNS
jgi:hypothetical protein